jgi:hypothetical protein
MSETVRSVGVIGLSKMGRRSRGISCRGGFEIKGFDVSPAAVRRVSVTALLGWIGPSSRLGYGTCADDGTSARAPRSMVSAPSAASLARVSDPTS